jgi:unsaturated rhamnogalacturonyl hydrolase
MAGRGGGGGSGGVTTTAGTSAGGSGGRGGSGGATGGAIGGSGGSASAPDAGAAGQGGGDAGSLASDSLAVRFANMILSKWPDPANITTQAGFEYNHGIVLRGMEQVFRHTGDSRYLAYIQKYIDENMTASGVINLGTTFSAFDNMQPSVLLPFLYQQTGLAKYQTAADAVRAFYDKIPTNADGGYWHKQSYPNQMWLDSIYMGEPFLARYGAVFGTCGTFCDATVVKQTTLIAQHTLDTATGLYYHAWWDSNPASTKPAWADANGRSAVIWGRAMGWYAMALVDMLGDLPADQTGRSDMLSALTGLAAGLKTTQDATTGLWYQVMDQGSKTDNWTETSASGMFVYALKVAVNRGYVDSSYLSVANKGWQGLQTKVTTDASGLPTITGAVQGMSVQTSYSGYVSQSRLSNSAHGLCAILLAAAEMEVR